MTAAEEIERRDRVSQDAIARRAVARAGEVEIEQL